VRRHSCIMFGPPPFLCRSSLPPPPQFSLPRRRLFGPPKGALLPWKNKKMTPFLPLGGLRPPSSFLSSIHPPSWFFKLERAFIGMGVKSFPSEMFQTAPYGPLLLFFFLFPSVSLFFLPQLTDSSGIGWPGHSAGTLRLFPLHLLF